MSILKLRKQDINLIDKPRTDWYAMGFIDDGTNIDLSYIDDQGTQHIIGGGGGSGESNIVGITIYDGKKTSYLSGFKSVIKTNEILNIPEDYQYIGLSLLIEGDGVVNNDGIIHIIS